MRTVIIAGLSMNATRSSRTAPAALPETGLPGLNEASTARAIPPLNSTARRALRAEAHHLDPVVMIGDSGLTPAVIAETDRALNAHQLIKIRVLGDDREVRRPMMAALCSALGCAPVQIIGKLLVVWRPLPVTAKDEGFVPKKEAARRAAARSEADSKPARPVVSKRKPSGRPAKTASGARASRSGSAPRSGGTSSSGPASRSGGSRSGGFAPPIGRPTGGRPTGGGGFGPRRSDAGDRGSFRSEGDRPTGGRPTRDGIARPARSSTGAGPGRPSGSRTSSGERGPRQSGTGFPSRPTSARAGSERSGSPRSGPARSGPSRTAAAKAPGRRAPPRKR